MEPSIEKPKIVDTEYQHTSPDDVRAIMGSLLNSAQTEDDMNRVSETIKSIQSFLNTTFKSDDLLASPYYHAVVGSSMKEGAEFDASDPIQRQIASTVILRLNSMAVVQAETLQPEEYSDFYQEILAFKSSLVDSGDAGLGEYFLKEISTYILNLQKTVNFSLTSVPEIDLALGGSGNSHYTPKASSEEVEIILQQFRKKFVELKDLINRALSSQA